MFTKKRLGIYLSPKKASIVEIQGKKILNKHSLFFKEEKTVLESENEIIKKVASFNEALREAEIKTKECFIGLSSEDLIIRSFIIPLVPSKEISQVISFEAKKYIPFPIEDIIFDFQYRAEKLTKKIEVIFAGIKREVFKIYNSIFTEVGFGVLSLEPGSFSLIRLLYQKKLINKNASFGLIDVNGEESNFTIVLKGFPFFNRQIKILAPKEEEIPFRFRSEVRISLDYFKRQFTGKDIDKIFLLAEPAFFNYAEGLEEEIGLNLEVLEPKELLGKLRTFEKVRGKDMEFNISQLKALGLALRSQDPKTISINLYKPETLIEKPAEVLPPKITFAKISPKVILKPLILAFFIILSSFFLGQKRSLPVKRELEDLKMRISSKIIPTFNTLSDLKTIKMDYQRKLSDIDAEVEKLKMKTALLFDSLSRLIPSGLWLEELVLTEEDLRLRGFVYLGNEKSEFATVYKFLSSLKESDVFTKRFGDIRLLSVSRTNIGEFNLTKFEISAR